MEYLALYRKYNGFPEDRINIIENEDYEREVEIILEETKHRDVFIIPSYSSMMKQRSKIADAFGGKEFWE